MQFLCSGKTKKIKRSKAKTKITICIKVNQTYSLQFRQKVKHERKQTNW